MDQKIVDLCDDFTHGTMSRRELLDRLGRLAGGSAAALVLPAAEVSKVSAPLLLHHAGLDKRINAGIADYEAALQAHDKPQEVHMYEDVNHAFNNDTSASRYDKAAAEFAWGRTVAFLRKHLAT